jgi:3-isopropylmalate dehydratase small subunit
MKAFTKLSAKAAPLPMMNVDTDIIIPKQFLKTVKRTGLGVSAFYDIRYNDDGSVRDDFAPEQPEYKGAEILITGENFGCGSSREHAPWAILDMGFRCIIAPSFADIFYNNSFKNGILPIALHNEQVNELMAEIQENPNAALEIDLEKQRVDGFEALIRWNHPDEGLLAPAQFLEHLEYTEYAAAVGRFVMADGARKLSQIMEQNLPYSISINLSPSHFLGRQFISDLAQALESIPFEQRNRLVIEVLETTALDEATKVISKLQKCKELGVRVSLDDFGTGFSSLDHFRRLPADEIKIDKSFVMDMLTDREDEVIVDAIIGLSSSFSRKVIAEGVENAQTAARLMDLGCQFAQGFFYSRPQPFEDALVWASTFSWSNYEPAR